MINSRHQLIVETLHCTAEQRIQAYRAIVAGLVLLVTLTGCLMDDPVEPGDVGNNPPTGSGNSAPSISGSPITSIKVGENYSFTPNASDPDRNELTFTIAEMPTWSSFNTSTGELSGSPILMDIGHYADIAISVSDGSLNASLQVFSIDVVDVGNLSVSLSWTPPTQNSDNSSLTNLAAYKIYYGFAEGDYPNVIRIDNPGIAAYVIEGLTANTYYFVATAINSSGMESDFSNVATYILN